MLITAVLVAIVLHELMHGVMAYWLGDRTAADAGRLTVNPLASIDPFMTILLPVVMVATVGVPFLAAKPVPFNPHAVKWGEYGAALVGLAGPATNFVLALLGAGLFHITEVGTLLHTFSFYFVMVNIGIMVFNMIPLPPLDGSRVLYAFAPDGVRDIMERIESFGIMSVVILVVVLFTFGGTILSEINSTIRVFLIGV